MAFLRGEGGPSVVGHTSEYTIDKDFEPSGIWSWLWNGRGGGGQHE